MHGGGTVGVGSYPQRDVPAEMFLGAPRLHQGLRGDEYPAILQYGERVIPRGAGGPPGEGGGNTFIFNIDAIDGENAAAFIYKNSGNIANSVLGEIGGNHPLRRAGR